MKPVFSYTTLSWKSRFVLAAAVYAAVSLLQFFAADSAAVRWFAAVILCIPLFFLSAKHFSSKPDDTGKEEWRPVTMKEMDRLTSRINKIRKAKLPFIYSRTAGIMTAFIAVLSAVFNLFAGSAATAFIIIDIYLIFIPVLWFASIKKWYPAAMSRKIREFNIVLTRAYPQTVKLVPYLRFDENRNGEKIPEDFKITIEPLKKPADFIGIQFQLTYNEGPNGQVPYMYAVCICKDCGESWEKLKKIRARDFLTETSSSTEDGVRYGIVVFRLDTECRSDGYRTRDADIERLVDIAVKAIGEL